MPARAAVVPRALRHRVFRGSQAIAGGLLSADQLRGRAYLRLFRDVYVHVEAVNADEPIEHRVRIEAAALLLPHGAVIGGRSALCLSGLREAVEHGPPVEVIVAPGVRFGPIRGLRVRTAPLPVHEVVRAPIPRTTPLRSCLDIAREPDLIEAIVALDLALGRGRVSPEELVLLADQLRAVPGACRAKVAVGLTDGRAESAQESRLRVLLALAGLRPVPQFEVHDQAGSFVARVDLAFIAEPDRRGVRRLLALGAPPAPSRPAKTGPADSRRLASRSRDGTGSAGAGAARGQDLLPARSLAASSGLPGTSRAPRPRQPRNR
ncbi:MAG: hypothetical protein ACR2JG_07360 [Geodermatophilaceae bacterium]